MSDTTTTTEDTPTPAPEPDAPEAEPTEEEAADKPGREAAKYRVRLRETEAERDRLAETLGTYRRREAETMAEAAGLARGADLFDLGTDLGELLTDEGTVDEAKVRDAVSAVLADRPHWRAAPVALDLGLRGDPGAKPAPAWTDVLRGR